MPFQKRTGFTYAGILLSAYYAESWLCQKSNETRTISVSFCSIIDETNSV